MDLPTLEENAKVWGSPKVPTGPLTQPTERALVPNELPAPVPPAHDPQEELARSWIWEWGPPQEAEKVFPSAQRATAARSIDC